MQYLFKTLKLCFILLLLFAKAQAQIVINQDEAKVRAYTLPDVLTTNAGKKVTTVAEWEKVRRPELLATFENEEYGQAPKEFDKIKYEVTNDVPNAMDGKAHLKEVTITVWKGDKSVAINLVLFTPNNHKGPASVFLLINNRGAGVMDPTRVKKSEFWPAETIIENGYAAAVFQNSDLAPDNKDTFNTKLLTLYPTLAAQPNGMKAIAAWAWGASRVMDYFKTNKDIDFSKVSVVGHSRGGKTALLAGAEDKRFAMVFASCSGNSGASLAHREFGETIKSVNSVFPHWFDDNYKKYDDHQNTMPFDQHMLIALTAPRPVYTTNATKDLWADPKGSYLSVYAAQKVWQLYGKPADLAPQPPPPNTPIINSMLGYHVREGVHNLTAYDWGNFIKFADLHYYNKQ